MDVKQLNIMTVITYSVMDDSASNGKFEVQGQSVEIAPRDVAIKRIKDEIEQCIKKYVSEGMVCAAVLMSKKGKLE